MEVIMYDSKEDKYYKVDVKEGKDDVIFTCEVIEIENERESMVK